MTFPKHEQHLQTNNKLLPTNTRQHPQSSPNRLKPLANNFNPHRKLILSRLNQSSKRRHNLLPPRNTKNMVTRNNAPVDSLGDSSSSPGVNL